MFQKKKKIYYIMTFFILIVVSIIITINITPKPIALLSRWTVFSGDANATPLTNNTTSQNKVVIKSDLTYPSKYSNNTFDIYQPSSKNNHNTTIIWIHGGGFVGGDKTMVRYYAKALANEGYTIITMNYALAPETKYPAPIIQTGELIRYLHTNQAKYNINLNNIVFAGDSAGAHIAAQFVITQTNKNYATKYNFPNIVDPKKIKALLLYCGPYNPDMLKTLDSQVFKYVFNQIGWSYLDNKDWAKNSTISNQLSITDNVSDNLPPVYITDGNTLSFEPMAKELILKLKEQKVEFKSRFFNKDTFGNVEHEFQFKMNTKEGKLVYDDTIQFLNTINSSK